MSGTRVEAPRTARRPVHRRRRLASAVAVLVALTVAAGACAEPAPDRAELVDLLERAGISADESKCAAKAVVDNLTDAQIEDIMQRGGSALVDDPKRTDDASDTSVSTPIRPFWSPAIRWPAAASPRCWTG